MRIPLPSIEEQREIVKKISRLEKLDQQIKNCSELDNNLHIMSNSILTKAFRGELVTNNPAEESSIELLKEILKSLFKKHLSLTRRNKYFAIYTSNHGNESKIIYEAEV